MQQLYIELTTMRQPLVTRKNRKLRLLRELYPEVRVRLLYRRDVERLLRAYEEDWRTPGCGGPGSVIASHHAIRERIAELAARIAADLRFAREGEPAELVTIGLEPGAVHFHAELVARLSGLEIDVLAERVGITRYLSTTEQPAVRLSRAPRVSVQGRDVLIVADVVSTGLSLAYLVDWLRARRPRSIEICALFNRAGARLIDLPIAFSGFDAPDEPLVGYGIGADPGLRSLPYVATLHRHSEAGAD
jgi:hypoxanthine phosphoribosyltransferase